MPRDLTRGSILKNIAFFAGPYLLACFLQTFYPIVDLFIAGVFNGASTISAIAIGGQVMHLLVMVIAGIAMGGNVCVGRAFGEKSPENLTKSIGSSVIVFTGLALILTAVSFFCAEPIFRVLQTPQEAWNEALIYTQICFLGVPFIAAYNFIASVYRGIGDTRHPLVFVAIGGAFNIILDYILIGPMQMGATGAAIATVIAQGISVLAGFVSLRKLRIGVNLSRELIHPDKTAIHSILGVGLPIAVQDGFIQIGFLVITAIANSRGLYVSAAVGIVEKIICFFFLVPSAMLACVSAIAAQNRGAGLHKRSKQVLLDAIRICLIYGGICAVICQPCAATLVALFTSEAEVIRLGTEYLRTYSVDIAAAGVHFCFSGYFCAYSKSIWSFIHNLISVTLVRVPGTWLAAVLFPATLYEMGIVTPMGSLVSVIICIMVYQHYKNSAFSSSK